MLRLAFAAVLFSACAGMQLHSRLAKDLLAPVEKASPTRVAVVPFTAAPGDQAYEKTFRESLTTALSRTGRTTVVERELMTRLLQEHRFQLSGAVDPKSAKEIGRLLGVDAVVTGTILRSRAKELEINARLVDVQTGKILSAARKVVRRKEEPAPVPIPAPPPTPPSVAVSGAQAPAVIARGSHNALPFGDKILLVGGGNNSGMVRDIELFDSRQGKASVIASVPGDIGGACVFLEGRTLYISGGCAKGNCVNINRESLSINLDDGRVSQLREMPTPRVQPASVSWGGWHYCISGGKSCPPNCEATEVEAFHCDKDAWKRLAPVPEGRRAAGAAAVNGRIYFIGGAGNDSKKMSRRVDRYDPISGRWTRLNDFPTPLRETQTAVLDDELYVLGGLTDIYNTSNAFWKYDEKHDRWAQMPPMPLKRRQHAAAVLGEDIYVFGGYENYTYDSAQSTVMAWNSKKKTWRFVADR